MVKEVYNGSMKLKVRTLDKEKSFIISSMTNCNLAMKRHEKYETSSFIFLFFQLYIREIRITYIFMTNTLCML